jgi:MFS family permease
MKSTGIAQYRMRLWTAGGICALIDFIFGATFVYAMSRAGLNGGEIGTLLAVSQVVSIVVDAPSGAWGDRYGQRRVMVIGLTAWGSGLVLFGVGGGAIQFGVALTLWGLGAAAHAGAPLALFMSWLTDEQRTSAMTGTIRIAQVVRWGCAACGAVLVAVVGKQATPGTMIVPAGAIVLGLAAWIRIVWPESTQRSNMPLIAAVRTATKLLLRGELASVLALSCITMASISLMIFCWQPIVLSYFHGNPAVLGSAMLVLTLATAFGSWASKLVISKPVHLLTPGCLVLIQVFLMVVGDGLPFAIAGFVGAEFFAGIAMTVLMTRAYQLYSDQLRNTQASLLTTGTVLAAALIDEVAGWLWQRDGIQVACRETAIGLVIVTLLVALSDGFRRLRERTRHQVQSPEAPVPASTHHGQSEE